MSIKCIWETDTWYCPIVEWGKNIPMLAHRALVSIHRRAQCFYSNDALTVLGIGMNSQVLLKKHRHIEAQLNKHEPKKKEKKVNPHSMKTGKEYTHSKH